MKKTDDDPLSFSGSFPVDRADESGPGERAVPSPWPGHATSQSRPNTPRIEQLSREWTLESIRVRYSYRFSWMGRPIIQYPQDVFAMQELLWRVQPDVVVECGIAHGGSLVFYASILQLLGGERKVIGVDVDIRDENRAAITAHPMSRNIALIQGSSIDPDTVQQVRAACGQGRRVLVVLDSNHTASHVLAEMRAYAPMVAVGSYLVVLDTIIQFIPEEDLNGRPWGAGNSPLTAVHQFLATDTRFEQDADFGQRHLITGAPGGFLRRKG